MSPTKVAPTLEELRKETLGDLEASLGRGQIGPEEYRQRAEVARHATDETELSAVRPAPVAPRDEPDPSPRAAPAAPVSASYQETGFVFACMGGSVRKGSWEPPETLYALSLMGGIELDFREAALLEGTTEVVVFAVMGGIKITVPDDIDVEVSGVGIMGGFEHVSRHEPGSGRPLLRVKGLALMGGVAVKVKPIGPTTAQRLVKRFTDLI